MKILGPSNSIKLKYFTCPKMGKVFYYNKPLNFITKRGKYISIPAYSCSDGFSIPRLFRWLFKNKDILLAAILHDFLYCKKGIHQFDRNEADEIFYDFLLYYKASKLKAKVLYYPVAFFGGLMYDKEELMFFNDERNNKTSSEVFNT